MPEEKVTIRLMYEKLDEHRKEEKELRHDQANRFDKRIIGMEEKFEKSFEKLEGVIKTGFEDVKNNYATKEEHKSNKNEIQEIKKDTEQNKKFILKFSGAILVIVPIITFTLEKFYANLSG